MSNGSQDAGTASGGATGSGDAGAGAGGSSESRDAGSAKRADAGTSSDTGSADAGTAARPLQLTFDDGPEPVPSALEPILRELSARKVRAAFFVIGEEVKRRHSSIARITSEGHVLGNHSWDHLERGTSNYTDAEIYDQFRRTHDEVRSAGADMQYWRAPRGDELERLNRILTQANPPKKALYALSHCSWQADSEDAQKSLTAEAMLASIVRDFANPGIAPLHIPGIGRSWRLLFHVKPTTAKALPDVLNALAKQGATFTNFTQGS